MMQISFFQEFKTIYNESGITGPYSDYMKKMKISLIVVFSITFFFTFILHNIYYNLSFIKLVSTMFSFCLISTNIIAMIYFIYPLYMRNKIRNKIENSLIYTLSYMKIIASSGSSIITVMEHVAEVDNNPDIKNLASKFVTNIKLLGYDVSSSLIDVTNRTYSKILKKIFQGISHNINTSGNLVTLFDYEIERLFNNKKEELKSLTQSLTYLGEIYVALMVVGPILFILMIVILSVFLGDIQSSIIRLNLIVFFGLPILASMFLVVLDTMLEEDE